MKYIIPNIMQVQQQCLERGIAEVAEITNRRSRNTVCDYLFYDTFTSSKTNFLLASCRLDCCQTLLMQGHFVYLTR
jgi:hypothetical protein